MKHFEIRNRQPLQAERIRNSRFVQAGKPWPLSIKLEGARRLGARKVSLIHIDAADLARQVTTPTLVIHSELDLRCPLSQGLQYYTVLKQAGVDAELLVFPGENHELSRSGTPWHRRQRFEAILGWWSRHLPV